MPDIDYTPTPVVGQFMHSNAKMRVLMGPVGCIAPETLVLTEFGPIPIAHIDRPMRVVSWNATTGRFQLSWCGGAFPKGTDYLYRVATLQGEFAANGFHRVLDAQREYQSVESLCRGQSLHQCSSVQQLTTWAAGRHESPQDAGSSTRTAVGWLESYAASARQYGLQLLQEEGIDLEFVPAPDDARRSAWYPDEYGYVRRGGRLARLREHIRRGLSAVRQHIGDWLSPVGHLLVDVADPAVTGLSAHNAATARSSWQFQPTTGCHQPVARSSAYSGSFDLCSVTDRSIVSVTREQCKRSYWDMQVLDTNNYVTADGTVHHNSGKSVGSCFEIVRRASEQRQDQTGMRKTRFAVVRETARQLLDTTIKTWLDWFPEGTCGHFMRTTKTYYFNVGDVRCEVMFRALDDADDVANLNSLELTGAWFNECRDIHPDIIDAMSKRVGRYPSKKDGGPSWYGMWGDTNPPTMDSWWYYQMEHLDPTDGVSLNDNGWQVFKQPSGRSLHAENIENLPEGYYDTQGRSEEYIRVYIDGEYGLTSAGQPVYKYFRTDYHMSKLPLNTILGGMRPVIIGLDCGLTPAAVLGQQDARGRALVLDELVSFDMGMQRFIRTMVKPKLYERFGGCPVLCVVDPAGIQRAQTDERSAVDIIKAEGLRVIPAKTNAVAARINAVDSYLMRQVDGDPAFLVDPRCSRLKAAMMGGYRYKPTGDQVIDKNPHSHVAEALQYLMLHINASDGGSLAQRREIGHVSASGWT